MWHKLMLLIREQAVSARLAKSTAMHQASPSLNYDFHPSSQCALANVVTDCNFLATTPSTPSSQKHRNIYATTKRAPCILVRHHFRHHCNKLGQSLKRVATVRRIVHLLLHYHTHGVVIKGCGQGKARIFVAPTMRIIIFYYSTSSA